MIMPSPAAISSETFADLVSAHKSMVFSIAYHVLRDQAVAEEVAQDVFLQLFRCLGKLESSSHVLFWLRKVTANRSIDELRKRKREATLPLQDFAEAAAERESGDPLLSRKLRALVGSLPEKPRLVMILRYQEDLGPEEIGRILGMPVGSVKSYLQRSLALLRDKLERSMGEAS